MMSKLTRKHEEAKRLLETYTLHKNSPDEEVRRKVHLDLDRFLMQNRETAIVCIERIIASEIDTLLAERREETKRQARLMRPTILKRLSGSIQRLRAKGGASDAESQNATAGDA